MGILWWGEPGPRPMPDRGGRNPAPLAANGRMFVQGDRVLFGLDAYNGTVLWTFFSPEMRRSNMPRDGSNMVATDDTLFVTISGECIALDAQTGKRRVGLHAPKDRDWGWLSASGGQLIMAAVKQGAAYKADSGEWYDSFGDGKVNRVVSDALVSHDSVTGRKQWTYQGGAVMNSTLTVAGDEIYFVESRNPDLAKSGAGRHMPASLNAQHLVALNRSSGRKLWEKPVDFSKCEHMLYLLHAKGTLIAAGSDQAKNYHTYAFDVSSAALRFGEKPLINADVPQLWKKVHPAGMRRRRNDKWVNTTDHGGLIQHPLVVKDVVYTDNRAYALRSGKLVRDDLPERIKCGNMAASNHSMFFRNFYHGIWDMETDERIQLEGIRSGCWLGIIPAQGLMLAPESSSGCSCTHSIQTSAAWIPKASLRKPKKNP
jgi:outer membrane protein assembly factor BamB